MADKALKIEEFLTQAAESEGVEIVDVQHVKENGTWVARIFIDKEGGVTMSDCEKMSRLFGALLDESDILSDSYVLEISSPGFDRALKNEKSFKRFAGSKARIQSFEPINNQKNFSGIILSCEDGKVKIEDVTKGKVEIELKNIRKANLETDI